MAWRKGKRRGTARLYVNGQEHSLPPRDASAIANAAALDGHGYAALSEAGRDLVCQLMQAGHYTLVLHDGEHE
ncbi:MAG: hypothetical protein KY442_07530 [Proteobacteria bacterium]|nr:hypothetical protein [Pseudomonadota bacterium]